VGVEEERSDGAGSESCDGIIVPSWRTPKG